MADICNCADAAKPTTQLVSTVADHGSTVPTVPLKVVPTAAIPIPVSLLPSGHDLGPVFLSAPLLQTDKNSVSTIGNNDNVRLNHRLLLLLKLF